MMDIMNGEQMAVGARKFWNAVREPATIRSTDDLVKATGSR